VHVSIPDETAKLAARIFTPFGDLKFQRFNERIAMSTRSTPRAEFPSPWPCSLPCPLPT
jgi:hypothetical protein